MIMLEVGTQAPDFSVNDHNGNRVSLKDFKGKKLTLWFYPKADTPGCTIEGKGFRDDYEKFKGKNTAVLGVSVDNQSANKAFAEKFSFPYPLLCDEKRTLSLAYHAVESANDEYAKRITYVINETGKITSAIAEVNTKTHASDICSHL
jgi:thioredoxin-dependent peroxiredoxin